MERAGLSVIERAVSISGSVAVCQITLLKLALRACIV